MNVTECHIPPKFRLQFYANNLVEITPLTRFNGKSIRIIRPTVKATPFRSFDSMCVWVFPIFRLPECETWKVREIIFHNRITFRFWSFGKFTKRKRTTKGCVEWETVFPFVDNSNYSEMLSVASRSLSYTVKYFELICQVPTQFINTGY